MRFLEDIAIGSEAELGSHTFTAEAIKRFASAFDPHPFHLDETAAANSHFGRLSASGWHTGAIFMRLWIGYSQRLAEEMAARGEQVAHFGPSPGFRDMKWLKPVYAGDVLTYRVRFTATRVSQSRPGWGLITMVVTAANPSAETVFSFTATVFLECRPR